jgi:hypothetical protein
VTDTPHEPTFWAGNDSVQGFVKDAVYQQKLQFIRDTTSSCGGSTTACMPGSRI